MALVMARLPSSSLGQCWNLKEKLPGRPLFASRVERISNHGALLAIEVRIMNWLPKSDCSGGSSSCVNDQLHLTLSSGLIQGEDFFLWTSPYKFPQEKYTSTLYLQLYPGKRWIPHLGDVTLSRPQPSEAAAVANGEEVLYLLSVQCIGSVEDTSSLSFPPIKLATIFNKPNTSCVMLSHIKLAGASPQLQQFLTNIFLKCQDPLVVKSQHLHWQQYSSQELLMLQPNILVVDGFDHSLEEAAEHVDTFLAAHSVLTISWEPMTAEEPRYWVLVPQPPGMPGHLLAALDQLQWRHPHIVSDMARLTRTKTEKAEDMCHIASLFQANGTEFNSKVARKVRLRQKLEKKKAQDEYTCPLGCPRAKLIGFSASGYGADAYNVYGRLRDGLLVDTPVQAFPTVLGARQSPPFWEGEHGWTYTFGACKSNFLDCYFLSHSPCPPVTVDIRQLQEKELRLFSFNKSRLTLAYGGKLSFELQGWNDLVGSGSDSYPLRAIQDLYPSALPSRHVFYSYIFRPNFFLRRNVYKRIYNFEKKNNLQTQTGSESAISPCATFHVRRGDILFHLNQARFYLPLQSYIKASSVYLKALNINTILLFTDSQAVIEEAERCAFDYPDLCSNLHFKYVKKPRWQSAEGGWENPFPSGNASSELLDLQFELALSQRCDLMVSGESEFGELLYQHMCCGFPIRQRGSMPQRCLCPPRIKLLQMGFTCEKGNRLLCGTDEELEARILNGTNLDAYKFSTSKFAFKQATTVNIQPKIGGEVKSFSLEEIDKPRIRKQIESAALESMEVLCRKYDFGPNRKTVCKE